MKVSVVFSDVSVDEADSLLRFVEEQELHLSHDKPKRKRRTKAEIAEAQVAGDLKEQADARELDDATNKDDTAAVETPVRQRRRRSATSVDSGDGESDQLNRSVGKKDNQGASQKGRKRQRPANGDPEDSSDSITDADVAKAASEAARELTPAVVLSVLEEFGVGNVAELSQEQRREFMDSLREEMDAEDEISL